MARLNGCYTGESSQEALATIDADRDGLLNVLEQQQLLTRPADLVLRVTFNTGRRTSRGCPWSPRLSPAMIRSGYGNRSDGTIVLALGNSTLELSAVQGRRRRPGLDRCGQDDMRCAAARLDANGDGRLTIRERRTLHERLKSFDRSGDGAIALDELGATYRLCIGLGPHVHQTLSTLRQTNKPETPANAAPEWFVEMDKNKDHDLSRTEFPGTDEQFQQLDSDADETDQFFRGQSSQLLASIYGPSSPLDGSYRLPRITVNYTMSRLESMHSDERTTRRTGRVRGPLPHASEPAENIDDALDRMHEQFTELRRQIAGVIVGQDEVSEQLLIAMLCRGHCILQGMPGLAKTMLVSTIASLIDLRFRRVQFTPDLMPGDITGTEVLQEDHTTGKRVFQFVEGPLFGNVILADEINRTPPKTQSALLEAMQERQLTVCGKTYKLPDPFFVLATQNPVETEGTYPLPRLSSIGSCSRFTFDTPPAMRSGRSPAGRRPITPSPLRRSLISTTCTGCRLSCGAWSSPIMCTRPLSTSSAALVLMKGQCRLRFNRWFNGEPAPAPRSPADGGQGPCPHSPAQPRHHG